MSLSVEHNNKQYGTAEKIAARARLHQNYTQAEIGWFEWVARQLPFREGAKILEIGCGPGWFWANAKIAFPANMELTLTDMSAGMVDEAERRCRALPFKNISAASANAEALPFADDAFDLIIAMHMLYHVPDQQRAIAEMYRVVRPGGFVAITTNDADNLAKLYELATAFGGEPHDPSGIQFSYARASQLMGAQFGNVQLTQHPARLRITS